MDEANNNIEGPMFLPYEPEIVGMHHISPDANSRNERRRSMMKSHLKASRNNTIENQSSISNGGRKSKIFPNEDSLDFSIDAKKK
jgi:hypothetical protein